MITNKLVNNSVTENDAAWVRHFPKQQIKDRGRNATEFPLSPAKTYIADGQARVEKEAPWPT